MNHRRQKLNHGWVGGSVFLDDGDNVAVLPGNHALDFGLFLHGRDGPLELFFDLVEDLAIVEDSGGQPGIRPESVLGLHLKGGIAFLDT